MTATTQSTQIKVNQEILIAGEKFRALKVSELDVFFAKVLKNGKLASHRVASNHGTYSQAQIDFYVSIGSMEI